MKAIKTILVALAMHTLPLSAIPKIVKMVKTFSPERGKKWSYTLSKNGKIVERNTIKNDRYITYTPETDATLTICTGPENTGNCKETSLKSVYRQGKLFAIDQNGEVSAKTATEIQALINASKAGAKKADLANISLVNVTVLIPVKNFKLPYTIRSMNKENELYDMVVVGSNNEQQDVISTQSLTKGGQKSNINLGKFHKASIKAPRTGGFYLAVDKNQAKKVQLRGAESIEDNTTIRMGSGGVFFIENTPTVTTADQSKAHGKSEEPVVVKIRMSE